MPSEQMQAIIDALRDHIPQDGSLTVEQHRAMHDALLARRPPTKTYGSRQRCWRGRCRMGLGRGRPGRPGGPALSRRRLPRRLAAWFPAVRWAPLPCLQGQDRRGRLPAGAGAPVPAALDDVIASYRA